MFEVSKAKLTAKPALPAFEDRPNGFVSRTNRTSENVGRTRARAAARGSRPATRELLAAAVSAASLEWKSASGSNGTTNVCCTVGIFMPWRLPHALHARVAVHEEREAAQVVDVRLALAKQHVVGEQAQQPADARAQQHLARPSETRSGW